MNQNKKHRTFALVLCSCMVGIVCLAGLLSTRWRTRGVIISEVRPDGNLVLYDAKTSHHGFIELYNNSTSPISLDGWYLSDSLLKLEKCQISDVTIQPGKSVVFWSQTKNHFKYLQTEIPLEHFLGFSLDETEYAILSSPDGRVVDKIAIPHLEVGQSYSKGTASSVWAVRTSTPGRINNTAALKNAPIINAPIFSTPAGFYDNTVELSIKADHNCTVYYTLDGTPPTTDSLIYNQPILLTDANGQTNRYSTYENISTKEVYVPEALVPKANVIRAISVDSNGYTSEETIATYFIGFSGKYGFENISTLSIVTDPDNLFDNTYGIYVLGDIFEEYGSKGEFNVAADYITAETNYSMSGKGYRRPFSLEFFNSAQELTNKQSVAASIHGGWSIVFNQKSFNLFAAETTNNKKEPLLPGIFEGDRDSLLLRTGGARDTYRTKLRDVLNQKLVEDRAIAIQRAIPCQVFVNGEYWGLYNLQERLDSSFIAAHYEVNKNNVVLLKNAAVVEGEAADYTLYQQLIDYAAANDLSQQKHYDQICEWIDIQSYIDYYCFQIYVANVDSVANNHARWRSKNIVDDGYGDGKWRWILYDTDDSAGIVEGKHAHMTAPEIDSFSSGHWSKTPMEDTLFSALICNEEFKLQFAETFIEMAETNFAYERVEKLIDEMCEAYRPSVVTSHHRFVNKDYTEDDFMQEMSILKDFYSRRYEHIYNHMVKNLGLEEYGYEYKELS